MTKNFSVLKAVESQIQRIVVKYGDQAIDRCDQTLIRDVLLLGYHLLLDILPSDDRAIRSYRGFLGSPDIDVKSFAQSLKVADDWIKHPIIWRSQDSEETLSCFKHSLKVQNLPFGFLKPLEPTFLEFFRTQSITSFKILNTWINFPGRANLRSLDLSLKCTDDYLSFEHKLKDDQLDLDLINEMNDVMKRWLADFTYEDFKPSHGPGGVAGFPARPSVFLKHHYHSTDSRLEYFIRRDLHTCVNDWIPYETYEVLDRTSDIVFVPKSILKNRTISKEPTTLQYFQQGVRSCLDRFFLKNKVVSHKINLHNADLSKDLAREGSLTGGLDTLDLSNASDSVTLPMVKGVFAGTPLYRALICTRSDYTRFPNGSCVKLRKFAPMGSALCFPVECLIFACICEVATLRKGRRYHYRVYGDDIVCDSRLTSLIITILKQLNFQLNKEKSFWGSSDWNFREACGGEYINGVDVDPFRMSRGFKSYDLSLKGFATISSADTVQSFISFANNAFERGLYNTRRCILNIFRDRYPSFKGLLYSSDSTQLRTFEDCCTNWLLSRRFTLKSNRRTCFQRTELKCIQSTAKKFIDDPDTCSWNEEDLRYFEYWRRRMDDRSPATFTDGIDIRFVSDGTAKAACQIAHIGYLPEKVSIRSTRTILSWKWVYVL